MLIPLGQVSLYLALLLAALAGALLALGALRRDLLAARAGRDALLGAAVATWAAVAFLLVGLVAHDFRLQLVAAYSSRSLPLAYRLSALWAGSEGSLLFWSALLAALAAAFASARPLDCPRAATGAVLAAALLLLLVLLNVDRQALAAGAWPLRAAPFAPVDFVPPDGNGLRLQLQTWAMAVHPPVVFAGYAVLTVPFAIAVGNLLTGRPTARLAALRRFLLAGWVLLAAGIALGAWWAYTELGWGGYWSWDPVENASLVPWLVATAALHTLSVTRRSGRLATTTLALSAAAFLACILATYITRSGFLQSVHAYAADPTAAGAIMWLLTHGYGMFIIGAALLVAGLLLRCRPWQFYFEPLTTGGRRRQTTVALAAAMLSAFAVCVAALTLGPSLWAAFGGARYAVTSDQFDVLGGAVGLALLAGLAVWPWIAARQRGGAIRRLAPQIVAALIAAAAALVLGRRLGPWLPPAAALVAAALAGQVVAAPPAFRSLRSAAVWIAHLSVIVIAVGLAGSNLIQDRQTFRLAAGGEAEFHGYTIRCERLDSGSDAGGRYAVLTAVLPVRRGEQHVTTLRPSLRVDADSGGRDFAAEVAVRSTWLADLYVAVEQYDPETRQVVLHVQRRGLVLWLWIGCALLVVAGLLALAARGRSATVEERP